MFRAFCCELTELLLWRRECYSPFGELTKARIQIRFLLNQVEIPEP